MAFKSTPISLRRGLGGKSKIDAMLAPSAATQARSPQIAFRHPPRERNDRASVERDFESGDLHGLTQSPSRTTQRPRRSGGALAVQARLTYASCSRRTRAVDSSSPEMLDTLSDV